MTTAYPPALAQHLSLLSDANKLTSANEKAYYSTLEKHVVSDLNSKDHHTSEKTLIAAMEEKRPLEYTVEKPPVLPAEARVPVVDVDGVHYEWNGRTVDDKGAFLVTSSLSSSFNHHGRRSTRKSSIAASRISRGQVPTSFGHKSLYVGRGSCRRIRCVYPFSNFFH